MGQRTTASHGGARTGRGGNTETTLDYLRPKPAKILTANADGPRQNRLGLARRWALTDQRDARGVDGQLTGPSIVVECNGMATYAERRRALQYLKENPLKGAFQARRAISVEISSLGGCFLAACNQPQKQTIDRMLTRARPLPMIGHYRNREFFVRLAHAAILSWIVQEHVRIHVRSSSQRFHRISYGRVAKQRIGRMGLHNRDWEGGDHRLVRSTATQKLQSYLSASGLYLPASSSEILLEAVASARELPDRNGATSLRCPNCFLNEYGQ